MAYNFNSFKEGSKKVEEWLGKEYGGVHTGRATPMILDTIYVEQYGAKQPVKNVASISVEDPKTLRVTPWDKSVIREIEKAIGAANVGLSVATDDMGLRVIFPMLTTENRQRMVKVLKEKLEEARISLRKERESELNQIKQADLPEDETRRIKDELQKLVDAGNAKLEEIFNKKEYEVMN